MTDLSAVESIYFAALERKSPEDRAAYLDRACGPDPGVRHQVERLLAAEPRVGDFLQPAPASATLPEGPAEEPMGEVVGRYRLMEQIGEGGMGLVFVAEQQEPVRRKVALKLIKPGMDSRQVVARFEAERQALALMDHPNIAKVLDAGTTPEGRPYFVMELVKGVPITEYADAHSLTPRQRLELFVQVCRAVQHAHQKGVIHRDIKPSNVLVAPHDGVPVVKVIDFGVAKALGQRLTEKTVYTRFAQMIGTPLYMSPEQAEINALDVDTRSDVYSLGVLLYELLTGTTPFDGERLREAAFDEIRRIIREEEPPKPSTRLSRTRNSERGARNGSEAPSSALRAPRWDELDWIVMRCLEKDRSRRYETANGVADDVERYLNDEPVEACPPSAGYRLRKFARRNRAAVLTAMVVAAALVAGAGAATWQAVRATEAEAAEAEHRHLAEDNEKAARDAAATAKAERDKAEAALKELAAALERERLASYAHRIALAHREWQADEAGRAAQLLEECPAGLRGWEWHYLRRLGNSERAAFPGHTNEVTALAFSPDGTRVASVSWREARVWDAATGKEVFTLPAQKRNWGRGIAFSPDGKRLAVAGFQTVTVYDSADGRQQAIIQAHDFLVTGVAFSPDGKRLATAGGTPHGGGRMPGGEVKVWDVAGGQQVHKLAGLPHWVNAVAFSPDGRWLAAGTGETAILNRGGEGEFVPGRVMVWDADSGELKHTFKEPTFWVTGVSFSPDSKRLAASGADATVRVWELPAGREVKVLKGHTGWVRAVAFSPDGTRIASAGDDKAVRVWDAATGKEAESFRGHAQAVRALAFSPDGTRLASGGGADRKPGEVRVWDPRADQQARTIRDQKSAMSGIAFSPDGKLLATSGDNFYSGDLYVRETATGKPRFVIPKQFGFGGVAFSPDGTSVAAAGSDGVSLFDPATGKLTRLLAVGAKQARGGTGAPTMGVAFSPDGTRVAASGSIGTTVWEAATGKVIRQFRAHPLDWANYDRLIAFSPDGKRLATATSGGHAAVKVEGREKTMTLPGEVKLWDVETGRELLSLAGGGSGLALSPDGKRIASGNPNGIVTVWDAVSGQVVFTLRGHSDGVSCLAFTPDGARLVSGSRDHTVRLWDAGTGRELLTLRGHNEPIIGVAFSPDGHLLASASGALFEPGQIKVWDASPVEK